MSPEFHAICKTAADELAAAMRAGAMAGRFDFYVWAIPPDHAGRVNGRLAIGTDCPCPGARCVRPSDCGASTFSRWDFVPYSAMASILATACRNDPVMPIY